MNSRRAFLKSSGAVAALGLTGAGRAALGEAVAAPAGAATTSGLPLPHTTRRGDMVYRELGSTGQEVSLIGLGGFHIGKQEEEAASIKIIRSAIDRGITFLDNCWDYNNGVSEIRMGKALRDGYRDKVVLMTKIDGRTEKEAAKQIDESLLRLETDHVDVMQFHEIIRLEDPDRIFAAEGAYKAVLKAKKAGKIRFVGFTGHKDPFVHARMLDTAHKHGFHFDTVQMPINVMDAHFRSFGREILPRAVAQGTAVLAMKTFGDHFILSHVQKSGTATAVELLHYSMSQPVSVVITGIDSLKVLDQAFTAARTWKPMTAAQQTALLNKTRTAAAEGKYELFKTSSHFDGTAMNPSWLGTSES